VYDFITDKGYDISIVHGYSIGGPTSIYLASQRKVDLLVTDRTFSSLHEVKILKHSLLNDMVQFYIFYRK
jgi:esterase/lipase